MGQGTRQWSDYLWLRRDTLDALVAVQEKRNGNTFAGITGVEISLGGKQLINQSARPSL